MKRFGDSISGRKNTEILDLMQQSAGYEVEVIEKEKGSAKRNKMIMNLLK